MRASSDASDKVQHSEIVHPPINFAQYERIVLSSPTWWYRPAVPMWSFVSNHDFLQRDVFLFLTGNSGYKTGNIEEFAELIHGRDGRFTGYHFIERGRVFWQLSDTELREEVKSFASSLGV